jgi:uncharacterized membrane protein (UPF0127 family)
LGLLAVGLVLVAGCARPDRVMSDTETDARATTTAAGSQGADVTGIVDRGDVPGDLPLAAIEVSGETWAVAVADDATERFGGLRGVEDLGDLQGMLFVWDDDSTSTFGMRNVSIALDIAWFDADLNLVGRASMTPCPQTPCRSYAAGGPFRYAVETVQGGFDGLEPLTLTLDP